MPTRSPSRTTTTEVDGVTINHTKVPARPLKVTVHPLTGEYFEALYSSFLMNSNAAFANPAHAAQLRRAATKPPLCAQKHASCRSASITMKKVTRGKGSRIQDDQSNAVDVFVNVAAPEDLLAAALAEAPTESKRPKKLKRNSKRASADEKDSADAGISTGVSSSDNAQVDEEQSVSTPQNSKKKAKKKKGIIIADESNAVDVFSGVTDPDQLLAEALSPETKKGNAGKKAQGSIDIDTNASRTIAEPQLEPETAADIATEAQDEESPVETESDFEPDSDVVSEFESFVDQLADFTLSGRRKAFKKEKDKKVRSTANNPRRSKLGYGSGGEKFTSIRLEDVSVTFRNTTILQGVTWGVQTGERVGLVGENGCGKTTQLKIIAGQLQPNEGEVVSASAKTKCSFLRQEFIDELDPRRTLREEFMSAFELEYKAIAEYNACEAEVSNAGGNLDILEDLLNKLEELRLKCEELDAWNLDTKIDKVMPGLGFVPDDNDKLVASFSGGWKVRIGLGKVLMQDPDLLLLDEPSNHLDSDSVEWLERFLQECALPMVIVSHDREFLDRVCTKIVEIEGGEAVSYPGNYSTFVKLKAERRKSWEAAYEKQQRFISDQCAYINRFKRSPARVSQVKSRQRMLDRMERSGELVRKPPHNGKPLIFRFPPAPRSGRDVVKIVDVNHGYESDAPLLKDANLEIERGDRIAVVGPNGAGKSTLLRFITGLEQPDEGTVKCKSLHNVSIAYYEQNQADALDLESTVLGTLKDAAPADLRYEELRALLGKFLFKGDAVEKKVASLSGGEKARLALAKIMLEPANVLVLDEPGNHLSISAKEMLEDALQHFDGTLIIVSHDRYLLSQVATQIVAIENQELVLHDGDYKSYMEQNKELFDKLRARFIPGIAEIKSAPKIVSEEPVLAVDKKVKRKKSFGGSGIKSGKVKEMNAKRWKK